MRIGMGLNYSGGFEETVAELAEHEAAGLDIVFVPEAYSFDAVSQLGYIAARTSTVEIASGILQIYTRTPSLTAMTAAGLDYVSNGRFTLGIGASGPQVIEGFHGVRYDAPLGRTREIVDVCRQVWRREKVQHSGKHYTIPLPAEEGTGLGKPLKIINHPVRDRIPIVLASIGPKNVALTAEIAEGWLPIFFVPERAHEVWGESLEAGKAKRDAALGDLQIYLQAALCITEDAATAQQMLDGMRPMVALYVGGMGAKGKNFYNDVARRYGYEEEADKIQDLYLDGKKDDAAAAVPEELVRAMSLIGPRTYVEERLQAFAAAGVTTINVTPLAGTPEERVSLVGQAKQLAADL
ncbi:LLM class F420-dependent oxidoreductase [Actinomycetospora sp. CA-101289]|uniref:LLM class F420-dependent oxidoreductase n=1 Tax=Actinomycetospora sp. CA-101289 TaxID=3239893 RepID=UPI003D953581